MLSLAHKVATTRKSSPFLCMDTGSHELMITARWREPLRDGGGIGGKGIGRYCPGELGTA